MLLAKESDQGEDAHHESDNSSGGHDALHEEERGTLLFEPSEEQRAQNYRRHGGACEDKGARYGPIPGDQRGIGAIW